MGAVSTSLPLHNPVYEGLINFIVQSAVIISPSNLMSTSQTQTTITVSWEHTSSSVISYEVSYTYQGPCSGVDDSGTETVAGPLTQHTLTGLEEFSTYMITVRAVYNGMESDSDSTSANTLPSGRKCHLLYTHLPL